MALIRCPECGKYISDKAKACPNCGYPMDDVKPQGDFITDGRVLVKYQGNATRVTIPSNISCIGEHAFMDSNVTHIILPSHVDGMLDWAFAGCRNLRSVVMSDSIEYIDRYAFIHLDSLENVTFGKRLRSIRLCAFEKCTALKSLEMNPYEINDNAFKGCTALTDVTILDNYYRYTASIRYDAFNGCVSLRNLTLSSQIHYIDSGAFSNCTSLSNIRFKGTKEQWRWVTKVSGWHTRVPATVVHCIDGDIDIDARPLPKK